MTSKTGPATPQYGTQGLGQWGQAHPAGAQQLGQSVGGMMVGLQAHAV
jgi:hypothetical protein